MDSNKVKVTITSYNAAQAFKKDYVRLNGQFLRFKKSNSTKAHKFLTIEVGESDSLDARGSAYEKGANSWNAHNCQSWAKFKVINGKLIALDYNGSEQKLPHWISQ
tara:strand:- start:958 stop:1275 length:318 start_codon:yes stop_codon:yes gene_type:complete